MTDLIKATANFVIETNRAQIVLTTERDYVSFTGRFNGSAGQCRDSFRDVESEDLQIVLTAWDALHLKPIPAKGTHERNLLAFARNCLLALDGARLQGDSEGGNADDFEEADFSNRDDTINSMPTSLPTSRTPRKKTMRMRKTRAATALTPSANCGN